MSAEKNVLACILSEAIGINQLDLSPEDFTEKDMHSRLYELLVECLHAIFIASLFNMLLQFVKMTVADARLDCRC